MEIIAYFYKEQLPKIMEHKEVVTKTKKTSTFNLEDLELFLDDRKLLETCDHLIQPICASIIITKDRQVLTCTTAKKGITKTSLHIGSHLNLYDIEDTNLESCITAMKREVTEETGFSINNNTVHHPLFIYNSQTEKLARHLGIIFPVVLDDTFELDFADDSYEWVSLDDLSNCTTLDPWSRTILEKLSSNKALNV